MIWIALRSITSTSITGPGTAAISSATWRLSGGGGECGGGSGGGGSGGSRGCPSNEQ